MKRMAFFVLVSVAAVMVSCSPVRTLNFISGASETRVDEDVAYGPHPRQKLDRYSNGIDACHIIFVYGGSWQQGDKSKYSFVGSELAKLGYLVSIPDYRLYPEVKYPEFVHDVALSVAYEISDNDNPDIPIILMGHSAGALIAGLLSYQGRYLQNVGVDVTTIEAFVSLAGPHDRFLPTDKPEWVKIFGEDKSRQIAALPISHVSKSARPTLILHGEDDDIVTPKSASDLHQKLLEFDIPSTLKIYPGVGHKRIIAAVGPPLQKLAPTLTDIEQYLQRFQCSGAPSKQ